MGKEKQVELLTDLELIEAEIEADLNRSEKRPNVFQRLKSGVTPKKDSYSFFYDPEGTLAGRELSKKEQRGRCNIL